jgi:hypothetical protein
MLGALTSLRKQAGAVDRDLRPPPALVGVQDRRTQREAHLLPLRPRRLLPHESLSELSGTSASSSSVVVSSSSTSTLHFLTRLWHTGMGRALAWSQQLLDLQAAQYTAGKNLVAAL